jgi:hypothetical protein
MQSSILGQRYGVFARDSALTRSELRVVQSPSRLFRSGAPLGPLSNAQPSHVPAKRRNPRR